MLKSTRDAKSKREKEREDYHKELAVETGKLRVM